MAPAAKVTGSFLYVADKRPVFAFATPEEAQAFEKSFKGAEMYGNKTHVFLPTPHGLEFVRGGSNGETAYGTSIVSVSEMCRLPDQVAVFHFPEQAQHWFQQLDGYGTMYPDGDFPKRTVFVGNQGQGYSGEPIWPGVA